MLTKLCVVAVAVACALVVLVGKARAAEYSVDFDAGKDANSGTAPEQALKHSPGDPAAEGNAKLLKLQPGDTVIFKGGVVYRGQVSVNAGGAEGKPIVFDGNTAGKFGQGRAIIDGSEVATGWKQCASADECGGNPNWKHIYYTTVSKGVDPFTVNLTQGNQSLGIAQDPKPEDPFFEDVVDKWRLVVAPEPKIEAPGEIIAGKGMAESKSRKYVLAFDGDLRTSALLDPCVGSSLTLKLKEAATATSVGIVVSQPPYQTPKDVVLLADGKEVLKVALEVKAGLQKFNLPAPVTFKEFTFKVITAQKEGSGYTGVEIQAYDKDGRNVLLCPMATVYRDDSYFTQTDPHYWDGAYFTIHGRPNVIYYQKVRTFDPATHTMTMDTLTAEQYKVGGEPPNRFSMLNALGLLTRAGEFVFDEKPQADGSNKVYVWPLGDQGTPDGIACSRRSFGFEIKASFVTVQGFLIHKQGARNNAWGVTGGGKGTSDILVRDNEITLVRAARNQVLAFSDSVRCTIDGNYLHENRRAGGIFLNRCEDSVISNNKLHKNGATGLVLFGSHHVKVSRNTLTDHKGMHANGLTAYLGCSDITFDGNRVSGGNVALTLQEGEDMTVTNNIFDGGGKNIGIAFWSTDDLKNVRVFNNLLLNCDHTSGWAKAIYANKGQQDMIGYVIKNNVIDGTCLEKGRTVDRSNNIYTHRGDNESQKDWKPGPGEIVEEDLSKIFMDPAKGDWRPRLGGPLDGTGVDLGLTEDITGAKVPPGKAPNIGAYQTR